MANVLEGQWEFETDYGDVWELSWNGGGITRMTGFGLPQAGHQIQRTPTQHGSSELGFRFEDREIIMGLAWACQDGSLQTRRRSGPYVALNQLASPLILRRVTSDHTVMELRQVFFDGGLEGDSAESYGNLEYAVARFQARDPVWYHASTNTITVAYDDMSHGLYASTYTIDSDDGLTTLGDWYAFPTIAITGPCTSFDLQSTTSGHRLRYYGTIEAGDVVTICTNPVPAYLSATNAAGDNVQPWIYPEDDFGGFALWPHPMATNGNNEWDLSTADMDANSSTVITWEDRYQGG